MTTPRTAIEQLTQERDDALARLNTAHDLLYRAKQGRPQAEVIALLIAKWRSTAHGFRTAVPISAFEEQQADAYETAADELEALLTPNVEGQ